MDKAIYEESDLNRQARSGPQNSQHPDWDYHRQFWLFRLKRTHPEKGQNHTKRPFEPKRKIFCLPPTRRLALIRRSRRPQVHLTGLQAFLGRACDILHLFVRSDPQKHHQALNSARNPAAFLIWIPSTYCSRLKFIIA